ncbi:hypothetical protein A2U01_0044156, partial [Trifolium medium]|nr:hypothetical protein [Trifolium medium]
ASYGMSLLIPRHGPFPDINQAV